MEEYYPELKEVLNDCGLDLGRKEVEKIFNNGIKTMGDEDKYFCDVNSADVFYNPKAIHSFFTTGEIKEYDEATQRGYDWIIANGFAKDISDIKARETEIMLQVINLEGYQRALMGV